MEKNANKKYMTGKRGEKLTHVIMGKRKAGKENKRGEREIGKM